MNQGDILKFLQMDNEYHSTYEIRTAFGYNHNNRVSRKLESLRKSGLVEKEIIDVHECGCMAYWKAI